LWLDELLAFVCSILPYQASTDAGVNDFIVALGEPPRHSPMQRFLEKMGLPTFQPYTDYQPVYTTST
jgi:hypothetical protein